jgi:hypothetical protein
MRPPRGVRGHAPDRRERSLAPARADLVLWRGGLRIHEALTNGSPRARDAPHTEPFDRWTRAASHPGPTAAPPGRGAEEDDLRGLDLGVHVEQVEPSGWQRQLPGAVAERHLHAHHQHRVTLVPDARDHARCRAQGQQEREQCQSRARTTRSRPPAAVTRTRLPGWPDRTERRSTPTATGYENASSSPASPSVNVSAARRNRARALPSLVLPWRTRPAGEPHSRASSALAAPVRQLSAMVSDTASGKMLPALDRGSRPGVPGPVDRDLAIRVIARGAKRALQLARVTAVRAARPQRAIGRHPAVHQDDR